MNGISALIKGRDPELSLILSAIHGYKRMAVCEPGSRLSSEPNPVSTLILDSYSPEL